jgi:hypothetical protein
MGECVPCPLIARERGVACPGRRHRWLLMDLLVLGCQAGMPASGQASSGYLVTAGGCRILLDCGPGVAGV